MKSIREVAQEFLARSGEKPIRLNGLAKRLGVPKHLRHQFEDILVSLAHQGQKPRTHEADPEPATNPATAPVSRKGDRSHERTKARDRNRLRGIVKVVAKGGWFTEHPSNDVPRDAYTAQRTPHDIFIPLENLADAHDGDEVLVRVMAKGRFGSGRNGAVEKVLTRHTQTFVGTYFAEDGKGFVQVDGAAFVEPIAVGDPGAKGAEPGDKVVIEMVRFPTLQREGEAVLSKLLGARGAPNVDLQAIIHEFGLADEFPADVLDAASQQALAFDETNLAGRTDFTAETIITIDPVDARDFDDAISLTKSQDGHWHLGVHIADVAYFVPLGSVLDREASKRGTSVYLPGRVLPMLPETISNSLASLQQGHVRYTKSVVIEFSGDGIPLHTQFHNSAIKVTQRFAYEQIMPLVRDPHLDSETVSQPVRSLLLRMHELFLVLRQRRFTAGALELYLPEVKIDLDRDGKVVGAHEAVHDESHQIIEEFMLAANVAVATKLSDLGIPFLRRVHDEPDAMKLKSFGDFVASLGFPLKKYRDRLEIQKLLNRVKGQPFEQSVNFSLLRSMRQAEYTAEESGHYALAIDNYCHFTSPIRRYPDLTVHRLIDQLVRSEPVERRALLPVTESDGQECPSDITAIELPAATAVLELSAKALRRQHRDEDPTAAPLSKRKKSHQRQDEEAARPKKKHKQSSEAVGGLMQLGLHCSGTERRAADAERSLIRVKLLRLMETLGDEVLDAVITGIEKRGVYARCVKYPVDGFIPLIELADGEHLDFDAATRTLTSRRGPIYRFGEKVRVRVARIDADERVLDWQLASHPPRERKAVPPPQSRRRPTEEFVGDEDRAESHRPERKHSKKKPTERKPAKKPQRRRK